MLCGHGAGICDRAFLCLPARSGRPRRIRRRANQCIFFRRSFRHGFHGKCRCGFGAHARPRGHPASKPP